MSDHAIQLETPRDYNTFSDNNINNLISDVIIKTSSDAVLVKKIVRIKEATMKTIVENGIEATTIAMIAKNAGVSGGYLYRTYKGKQDLINELYYDKVNSLYKELEFLLALNQTSVRLLIESFIQNRVIYFLNEPIASKFFYQLRKICSLKPLPLNLIHL